MKYFILAVAFLSLTFTNAFAGGTTKAANDAAIAAGRLKIAAKAAEFETKFNAHNYTAATTAAMDVVALMWQGYQQTNTNVRFVTPAQQKAEHDRAMSLEKLAHEYTELSKNITANGSALKQKAATFIQKY